VTYTRGLDLSATLQGAGGIGGLLARSHGYVSGTGAWSSHNFYQADAGGNITAMADNHATSASLVANYRYDPFGRIFYQSGTLASANVYRFSSKEQMPNSGLYYYGFRFYDPLTQRWLNRDPLGEPGFETMRGVEHGFWRPVLVPTELFEGANIYAFVRNNPISYYDAGGLESIEEIQECLKMLDEHMRNAPMHSPEWYEAQRQKSLLYGQLRKQLLKRAVCRTACRAGAVGASAGVGAFTGFYIQDEVNKGFYTAGLLFWDWWYGNNQYEIGINF
jgi:RHS repeat-associated protein